jgi:3'-phosphoadenosine 5'-phosphosulfate sulfotransferase (PAPS reductase)/FAD synthetase
MNKGIVLDNDFFVQDRIQKIQQIISQYGEDNFTISFSGGKDSTVLSALVDMALPENKIPRLYANTGIELEMIKAFVAKKAETDKRIIMLKPSKPITKMLQEKGYPFKSKAHSEWLARYQKNGKTQSIKNYLGEGDKKLCRPCPQKLKYQFSPEFTIKVSDQCCVELKEKPLNEWAKNHNKPYAITGIMREEGGRRMKAQCLAFKGKKLKTFNPLAVITKEWEEWFIDKYNIEICEIYKPPYNFKRTGCKGCPFAVEIQKVLETMQKYFPNERKQCEIIWKPVYEEYRRIGYRLKTVETLDLFDDKEK